MGIEAAAAVIKRIAPITKGIGMTPVWLCRFLLVILWSKNDIDGMFLY